MNKLLATVLIGLVMLANGVIAAEEMESTSSEDATPALTKAPEPKGRDMGVSRGLGNKCGLLWLQKTYTPECPESARAGNKPGMARPVKAAISARRHPDTGIRGDYESANLITHGLQRFLHERVTRESKPSFGRNQARVDKPFQRKDVKTGYTGFTSGRRSKLYTPV